MSKTEGLGPNLEGHPAGKASRYLVFYLSGSHYSVPLLKVREVMAMTEITPVPYTPPHFKGIINLRGQVITVIDLRLKLQVKIDASQKESAIIILDLISGPLGIIVDSVESVVAVHPENVQACPDLEGEGDTEMILGITRIGDKLILILEIEKALILEAFSEASPFLENEAA